MAGIPTELTKTSNDSNKSAAHLLFQGDEGRAPSITTKGDTTEMVSHLISPPENRGIADV
jgi:hypothetical protein